MRVCSKCKIEKDNSEYNKKTSRKDGLQTFCRDCSRKTFSEQYRTDPTLKASSKARKLEIRQRNRKFVFRYKRFCGCKLCGEKEPVALDLHHLNGEDKDYGPANMLDYAIESIKKEFRKCVVLCSNCHRKVHAGLLSV